MKQNGTFHRDKILIGIYGPAAGRNHFLGRAVDDFPPLFRIMYVVSLYLFAEIPVQKIDGDSRIDCKIVPGHEQHLLAFFHMLFGECIMASCNKVCRIYFCI